MQDIKQMQLGQVVDFCIEYNLRHKEEQEEQRKSKAKYRYATADEVKAYFG